MVKVNFKSLAAALAVTCVIPASAMAAGGCETYETQLSEQMLKVRGEQTGGFEDPGLNNPSYLNPNVKMAKDILKKAKSAGCNLGPQWAIKNFTTGGSEGIKVNSEYTPPAPSEDNIIEDPTYESNYFNLFNGGKGGKSDADKEKDAPPKTPTKTPVFKYGTGTGKTTPKDPVTTTPTLTCGEVAAQYGTYLTKLKGTDKPTYAEGCAGVDTNDKPVASADKPATICTGNSYGKFGLVQAAYNNSITSQSVESLVGLTPASSKGSTTVAYNNTGLGTKSEPNGCRLTSYSSCGKKGDVILLQSSGTATQTDAYDTYLVYGGGNMFYEVENSSAVVRYGPLKPEYSTRSYAAVRMGCNSTTAKTTTTAATNSSATPSLKSSAPPTN